MADSNRTRVTYIPETTLGVTPGSPSMRTARITGESLNFNIANTRSEELRADRQTPDLIQTNASNSGAINFEMSYPLEDTFISDALRSALFNEWRSHGRADGAEITSVATNGTLTMGSTMIAGRFTVGALIYLSGFNNSGNNGLRRVSGISGAAVTIAPTTGLVGDTNPDSDNARPRVKLVGFEGAAGDIETTSAAGVHALTSSALDLDGWNLQPGDWIKIGGTVAANQFTPVGINGWARVSSVAEHSIGLDRVPAGFVTNTGTGKTIRVFIGDAIQNGVTLYPMTIEKGFLSQAVPSFLVYRGCLLGTMSMNVASQSILTGSFEVLGTTHTAGTASLDSEPEPATVAGVMNAVSNVGRVAEAGVEIPITGPNFIQELTIEIGNNLREQGAVGILGLSGVGAGDLDMTGNLTTIFGNLDIYNKYVEGAETSFDFRVQRATGAANQALVVDVPRIKFETGTVVAEGRNQDVQAAMTYRALLHAVLGYTIKMQRFEYYEA